MSIRRRLAVLAFLTAAPVAGLAGCSDDDGGTVGTEDVATTLPPNVEQGDITPTTAEDGTQDAPEVTEVPPEDRPGE